MALNLDSSMALGSPAVRSEDSVLPRLLQADAAKL
jgi:hypothetical protein